MTIKGFVKKKCPELLSLEFQTKDEAIIWVIHNQFGRRNLSAYQRSVLALKLEDLFRASAKERQILGGKEKVVLNSAQPDEPKKTRDKVAKVADVGHDTIAKVKVIEEKATPEIKEKLAKGGKSSFVGN